MKRIALLLFVILITQNLIAHPGIGIVMDSKGQVFYTDLVHVWKLDAKGNKQIALRNVHTHELYIDDQDNLYGEHSWYEGEATDKWGFYIWRLTPSGEFEKIVPDTEGFPENNRLVRDALQNEYWQKQSGDHEILMKTTAKGDSCMLTDYKFVDIRWIFSPGTAGNVYVVDHLAIKKISPEGQVTLVSDKLKEKGKLFSSVRDMHHLMGLWTNEKEEPFVAVFGSKKIKKITNTQSIETVYESPANWSPSGGLFDPSGNMWILEYSRRNKARVRRIGVNGKISTFE